MFQITSSDRICRPCVQRANRYYTRERQNLARIADAVSSVHEPSSGESAEGPMSDPLRDVSPPIPQGMPDEVPIRAPDEIVMQVSDEDLEENVPQVELQGAANPHTSRISVPGFSRASCTSSYCVVAQCNVRDGLHRINIAIRSDVLRRQNIYIPAAVRVCNEHLHSNVIWRDLEDYIRSRHETFNSVQVADMLKLSLRPIDYLDFEKIETIDAATFQYYIGFSKTAFLSILDNTPSLQQLKQPKRALAMVLSKLHTGDSNERLSSLFRLSPVHFGRVMKKVRIHLLNEFVPLHLGLSRNTETEEYREELRRRTLSIPNFLYGSPEQPNRVIAICDGTYIYVQKSSNYLFQKKTYSLHKYRNLLKMFMIVSPDGYVIEAFGPYGADKSDAIIMGELIENEEFRRVFQPGDVFILDRGFRDVIGALEALGYRAYMPKTKSRHERQLTTQDANESRKVTICRWVVETVNGHIKNQFRQLRNQYSNVAARKMYEEFRIACALLNAFGARYNDHNLVNEIMNQINLKQNDPNTLSEIVIQNNLNHHRVDFQTMEANVGLEDFPVLTKNDLIIIALGTYQIAQARSYYGEHIKTNGAYVVQVCRGSDANLFPDDSWLLRAKIQSRHSGNRTYFVYILINNLMEGRDKVAGWYCSCIVGKRTLGCCSHIMCVIWFMAWGRHQETLLSSPAAFLDSIIVRHDIENEANDEF